MSNSLLRDVKSLPELYEEITGQPPSGLVWDAITTLIEIDQTMQHVFLEPPGMNQEAAAAIRAAIMQAFTTDAYRHRTRSES